MRLSSSCLSVGNNSGVIAFQDWDDALLSSVFVDKFLCCKLIIYEIKCKILPNAQMWVEIHILLPLLLSNFCTKIFHDGTWLIVGSNLYNGSKLAAVNLLSLKRRPDSDYNFEVLPLRGSSTPCVLGRANQWLIHLLWSSSRVLSTWPLWLLLVILCIGILWLPHVDTHIQIHVFLFRLFKFHDFLNKFSGNFFKIWYWFCKILTIIFIRILF